MKTDPALSDLSSPTVAQRPATMKATPARMLRWLSGSLLLGLFLSILPLASAEQTTRDLVVCQPTGDLDPNEEVGPIVMNNMRAAEVLAVLQKTSGRVILGGSGLPDARINFNSGTKLSRIDAIFAIESVLSMNGINLISVDDRFVRAVPTRDAGRQGVQLVDALPEEGSSSQFYAKIFNLTHLRRGDAFRAVSPLISGGRQSTAVQMIASDSIFVVDALSNLRTIERVLEQVDRPGDAQHEVYLISLANANVGDVLRNVDLLRRTTHADVLRNTRFFSENRTNQLIVSTTPDLVEKIREIVVQFDEDVAPLTTSRVFHIQHANIFTVHGIVNSMINHQRRVWSQRRFAPTGAFREDSEEEGPLMITGPDEDGEATEDSAPETLPGTGEGGELIMMEGGMPELQFSPYLSIFRDHRANSIIAYGTEADLRRLEALIKELDVERAPYTDSELIFIEHADVRDIGRVISSFINTQRWLFGREGLRTAPETADMAPDEEMQGLRFSNLANVVTDRRSNAILAYGTQGDLHRIRRLVEELDIETAPTLSSRSIALRHAGARVAASLINNVINRQRSALWREGLLGVDRERVPETGDGPEVGMELDGSMRFSSFVSVTADDRTNSLLVSGTRSDLEKIEQLVEEMDTEVTPFTASEVVYLEHSQATTLAGIIARIINTQRVSFRRAGLRTPEELARAEGEEVEVSGTEFSSFATVVADRRINALVIYGTQFDIRRIQRLIEKMDVPVDPATVSEVFKLQYARSDLVVNLLNRIVQGQRRASQRVASFSRIMRAGTDEALRAQIEGDESLQFSEYVTLVADRRSNSVVGYGTPNDLEQLRLLVQQIDVEVAPYTRSKVFRIRHGDAMDVTRTIQQLISNQQAARRREATLQRVFARGRGDDASALGMEGLEDLEGLEGLDFEAEGLQEQLLTVVEEFGPAVLSGEDEALQFSPFVSVVAENRSNSVVVYGTEVDIRQVEVLLEELDVVLPQVRIEVVIAEVSLSDDEVSGLASLGFHYQAPFDPEQPGLGRAGVDTRSMRMDSTGEPVFSTGFTLRDFSLQSVFEVAQRKRNVKVLSAPTIVTTHNRQATINVGESRPVITGTTTSVQANLATRSTIEFRDIGIELRVRPLIGPDSHIQLDIDQVVDTVVDTQTIDGNQQPIIGTRRASSFISVRDLEVIVLGGLQSVDRTQEEGRVFLLGSLPVLGQLFRPTSVREEVRELIIFIKPQLVESTEVAKTLGERELQRSAAGSQIDFFLREGRFENQGRLMIPEELRESGNGQIEAVPFDIEEGSGQEVDHD